MTSLCSLCPLWLFIHMKNVARAAALPTSGTAAQPLATYCANCEKFDSSK